MSDQPEKQAGETAWSKRYPAELEECETLAKQAWEENDGFGANFHEGRASGLIEADILVGQILADQEAKLTAMQKERDELREKLELAQDAAARWMCEDIAGENRELKAKLDVSVLAERELAKNIGGIESFIEQQQAQIDALMKLCGFPACSDYARALETVGKLVERSRTERAEQQAHIKRLRADLRSCLVVFGHVLKQTPDEVWLEQDFDKHPPSALRCEIAVVMDGAKAVLAETATKEAK